MNKFASLAFAAGAALIGFQTIIYTVHPGEKVLNSTYVGPHHG